MEDNISLSPKFQQTTLNKLSNFGRQKQGEVRHCSGMR